LLQPPLRLLGGGNGDLRQSRGELAAAMRRNITFHRILLSNRAPDLPISGHKMPKCGSFGMRPKQTTFGQEAASYNDIHEDHVCSSSVE
jgi:hypothetical protein